MRKHKDYNVEYKSEYVDDIKKEVLAFVNGDGGKIFIGVGDNGEIIGVDDSDEVMLKVTNSLKDNIVPDVMPFVNINVVEEEGKEIVQIEINVGTNRPYYLRNKGLKPSGVYIRKGSGIQQMSEEAIKELLISNCGRSYELSRSLNQELSFKTLDEEFKKRKIELGQVQKRTLEFINEEGLYTNLGLLLSDQCNVTTKLAIFQGIDKEIFRDRKEFSGSLLKQLNDIYMFLDMNNKTKAIFSGLDRIDINDYPKEALREALLNAIVHRDYSIDGSNIINIYEDRIEFVSVGGLISSIELESIFLGASRTRNPKLANIFFRLKLIESYGTGVAKIIRSYKDSKVKPKFETAKGVFRVTLPNINNVLGEKESCVSSSSFKYEFLNVDNEKEMILDYVSKNGFIKRKDVESLIGSGTTKACRLLKELCKENRLKQVGSGKLSVYTKI